MNHATALISDDYSRSQNYPQNVQDGPRYRPSYDESTLERTDLEKNPVNGFNYQAQSGESLDQEVVQRPKNYQLDGKAENSDFELATTVDPRLRTPEEQRYSQVYEVNVPQNQPEYSLTGQDNLHRVESDKIEAGVDDGNPNERPIFIPLPENKQEDYELPVSPTEIPLSDVRKFTFTRLMKAKISLIKSLLSNWWLLDKSQCNKNPTFNACTFANLSIKNTFLL